MSISMEAIVLLYPTSKIKLHMVILKLVDLNTFFFFSFFFGGGGVCGGRALGKIFEGIRPRMYSKRGRSAN